jgi:hypothetical protein
MPDPCENCSRCEDCPWCPGCDPCGPPGGLVDPNGGGKPELGLGATFYGWENGHNYPARIDAILHDGLYCAVTIFVPENRGEYSYRYLPLVNSKHDKKFLRSVKNYLEERKEFLEVVGRHMHAFGEEWKASGNPMPQGGFIRWGNGTGEYLVPRQEGRDCRADVFKEVSPGVVDLRLLYSSGLGGSNATNVQVLTPELAQSAKNLRSKYVAMRQPHWDAAMAEWGAKY